MRYETSNVDIGAKLKIEGDLVDTVQRRLVLLLLLHPFNGGQPG